MNKWKRKQKTCDDVGFVQFEDECLTSLLSAVQERRRQLRDWHENAQAEAQRLPDDIRGNGIRLTDAAHALLCNYLFGEAWSAMWEKTVDSVDDLRAWCLIMSEIVDLIIDTNFKAGYCLNGQPCDATAVVRLATLLSRCGAPRFRRKEIAVRLMQSFHDRSDAVPCENLNTRRVLLNDAFQNYGPLIIRRCWEHMRNLEDSWPIAPNLDSKCTESRIRESLDRTLRWCAGEPEMPFDTGLLGLTIHRSSGTVRRKGFDGQVAHLSNKLPMVSAIIDNGGAIPHKEMRDVFKAAGFNGTYPGAFRKQLSEEINPELNKLDIQIAAQKRRGWFIASLHEPV